MPAPATCRWACAKMPRGRCGSAITRDSRASIRTPARRSAGARRTRWIPRCRANALVRRNQPTAVVDGVRSRWIASARRRWTHARIGRAGGAGGLPRARACAQIGIGPDGAVWIAGSQGLFAWNAGDRRLEPVPGAPRDAIDGFARRATVARCGWRDSARSKPTAGTAAAWRRTRALRPAPGLAGARPPTA